jgi:aminoglycoside phosphotransferase (APT) family kinase protein
MAIDPRDPVSVGVALTSFVTGRLGVADVRIAETPAQVPHGWDTHTYFFRLEGPDLPDEWTRPLVLRLYADADQQQRAETDVAIQRFVSDRGFPAARPLAFVGAGNPFGAPFMIMERLPGRTMVHAMGWNPFRASRYVKRMAELHAQLHALPVDGWPLSDDGAPLVDRHLAIQRAEADRLDVHIADGAMEWLEQRRGAVVPEEPSICHGDFHPLNLVVDRDGSMAAVDWGGAVVGDRHFDVANTLMVMTRIPTSSLGRMQRIFANVTRRMGAAGYRRAYERSRPLDERRMRYWEMFLCVRWWLIFEAIVSRGAATGLKEESLHYVRPEHVEMFRRRFQELADAWTD